MLGFGKKKLTQNEIVAVFNEKLQEFTTAATRSGPYGVAGQQTNSNERHDLNCDFGYPDQLEFCNFFEMYDRFGIASAVVDIPPSLSWLSPPTLESSTAVEKEFNQIVEDQNLWNRIKGLDKRQRVGQYAGLFVEVKDGKPPSEELKRLPGSGAITNFKPVYQGQLTPSVTQTDITKPHYGDVLMYQYSSEGTGDRDDQTGTSVQIHPSRIIIAAEGADDGSIYGVSALKPVFNDLRDLRKIVGATAEGFYQNSRAAPIINIPDDFQAPDATTKEALDTEIDDYLSKYNKKFIAKGMEFQFPNVRLDDPKNPYTNSINNVSAGSEIPSAILIGQQTGVRAADNDFKLLMITIQSRRENFLNELVKDVVDWMMKYGALPTAPYELDWEDLTSPSDDERLDLSIKMSTANQLALASGISPVFTEDEIREAAGFEPLPFEIPTESLDDDIDDMDDEELLS
jgi:hypothetical protein